MRIFQKTSIENQFRLVWQTELESKTRDKNGHSSGRGWPKLFHDRSSQLVNIHSRRVEDDRRFRLEFFEHLSLSPNPIPQRLTLPAERMLSGFTKPADQYLVLAVEKEQMHFDARLGSHSQDLLHVLSEWLTPLPSSTRANRLTSLLASQRRKNDSTSVAGRLSTQKYPESSRARIAVVFPEPETPLTITNEVFCVLLSIACSPCSSVIGVASKLVLSP